MNWFKRFYDFLLFGNIYVAIGAVCLIQSTIIQLGISGHLFEYSALAFFATLFIYNLQRLFYSPQKNISLHSIRRKWIFDNQLAIKWLSAIGFTGVVIFFFLQSMMLILYLSPLLFLTLAYFLPFVRLRKSPWFKLLTLTTVWTVVTAVVPMLLVDLHVFTQQNILHLLVRFTFMIAICIPFDIRDLEIDKADNISTLPHIMGEKTTRLLAFAFMIVYTALIIIEYYLSMFRMEIFAGLITAAVLNAILVVMTSSKRNEYFYVAVVDGTMIFQGIILIAASYL